MSVRNVITSFLALSFLAFLVGCGSSNSTPIGQPPPSGSFSNSNLNGTYVFSVLGIDAGGNAYTLLGQFTANGNRGITAGVVDINDTGFAANNPAIAPLANSPIRTTGSSYSVGADGRGTATLVVPANPLGGTILLDFVLQNSFHGFVTEYDTLASGSGTLDQQTANTTPNGSYAFSFSGGASESFATVGNFTLSGGTISGLEDFNSGGAPYTAETLSGNLTLGPSLTPSTLLSTTTFAITYDVFAIDASHLKFIEMDAQGTAVGDAFSQTSTSWPTGTTTFAFTLGGFLPGGTAFAAGGFMVTDGSGNITNASNEDFNEGNITASTAPIPFLGSYAAGGSGRFVLDNLSGNGFIGGTEYAAYPSNGGLLLLEIDGTLGIEVGAAYSQTSTSAVATSQGYGLNLSGINLGAATGSEVEVDDIAEFAIGSGASCGGQSGVTMIGLIDENFTPGGGPIGPQPLCATYVAPDANGRSTLTSAVANGTLNGGFILTFYPIDGTTFPFIESDGGQVSTGVFVEQNAAATTPAAIHSDRFVALPLVMPHAASLKNNKKISR